MIKNIVHEAEEIPHLNEIMKESINFTYDKTERLINGIFDGLKLFTSRFQSGKK